MGKNRLKIRLLTFFNVKNLHITKKKDNFAQNFDDDYEPTALATDSGKVIPLLEGEDAESFIRMMEENERKAKENAKIPMTKEEAEKRLSCKKIMLDFEENRLEELKKEIKKLEDYIKKN